MTTKRVSVKGQGNDIFGRGVNLLFGDTELDVPPLPEQPPAGDAAGAVLGDLESGLPPAEPPWSPPPPVPPVSSGEASPPAPPPVIVPAPPVVNAEPATPAPSSSALPKPQEPPMTDEPATHDTTAIPATPTVIVQGVVGVPTGNGAKPEDVVLSEDLKKRVLEQLSDKEAREILNRLTRRDREKLDREIDDLYDKVSVLLSGQRSEATTAFELLRKARQILLLQPEQFAEAEFLVRQVRARVNQIEQSIAGGARYGRGILLYQLVWMFALALLAIATTVSGSSFVRWVAWLLNVPLTDAGLQWAVIFISTLAWGGIGGVTSALWSLHYHVSVRRDYDPVENLWYYSQPIMGMVVGGIVYLIMASGFLIVNVNLGSADAALGARLLPAAVAVVIGFQQSVFLRLIERIVELISPSKDEQNNPDALAPLPRQDAAGGREEPPQAPAI